ncbi:PIN domain-containing protein [Sphingomonas lenta]|uniref:Ribonuclease VapC n=1 Tax=Sphingomonas lenta TaxID=1141887 RepID=A0A2A2SH51_9SPHN|nr:PIN domain-containing protein [Sphingomonas lenta]PAX08543.1 VapC toxin family PIN domain ribonuclease [Sphingomonas lenta]
MRFLLDTSAAIILRDSVSEADRRLTELASIPALSIITQIELEGGVVAEPLLAAKRRMLLDAMLLQFPVLDFDADCAAAYREIVEARGYSRPKVVDRMVAATALRYGLTVVTANARDFRDVPGLALEVWPSA